MVILIPAYEPDHRLLNLILSIRSADLHQPMVIVDDGSGPAYATVFAGAAALGADVIGHDVNRGKGCALKRGFAHVDQCYPGHSVVCADCDGQHNMAGIAAVADAVAAHPGHVVLGSRWFSGDVPARSRFGNNLTRRVFKWATGQHLQDTQTGLRGYPAELLGWLQTIPGDRFEYELEVLLAARRDGVPLAEVPVATIYLDGNASSHFRPLHDSVRVYAPFVRFLRFGASSLAAFALDATLLFALMGLTGSLLTSVVLARVSSATMNYLVNRHVVFGSGPSHRIDGRRYATLAAVLLGANLALIATLTGPVGLGLVAAKALTETTLYLASFRLQRRWVFAGRRPPPAEPVAVPVAAPAAGTAEVLSQIQAGSQESRRQASYN